MTCTYDGQLKSKSTGIEPCCADMHRLIINKIVYGGKLTVKGMPSLCVPKIRTNDRSGLTFSRCPFCGAFAEVFDVEGTSMGIPGDEPKEGSQ